MTYVWLTDQNSRYAFADEEMRPIRERPDAQERQMHSEN
jgi:hypothetical protein